ncbi:hypothetical protein GIY23_21365 [Allosaccharopolyspora coralli]|uniref:Uncharacterized protein n=1 Tax=Allosaccharopolyspora coralli TaxID=2665642 RepID=A0A5Q3QBG9_9PSEU|nr:hypothetical protein [Allosaccharopolyspora coralli]QGK71723.1 hypothetical protein GIY23_21365 [Allosaccharopolyspora coralli]
MATVLPAAVRGGFLVGEPGGDRAALLDGRSGTALSTWTLPAPCGARSVVEIDVNSDRCVELARAERDLGLLVRAHGPFAVRREADGA